MFDLEAQVSQWRRQLEARWPGGAADPERTPKIDELEDHLREQFAAISQDGPSPEEAWALAEARLGAPALLCREFARGESSKKFDRVARKAILAAAAALLCLTMAAALSREPRRTAGPILVGHVIAITVGYLAGLVGAGVAARAALTNRVGAQASRDTLRWIRCACLASAAFTFVGVGLGSAWVYARQGDFYLGDPRELGGLAVIVGSSIAALWAWRPAVATTIPRALAMACGGVILAAWFASQPAANPWLHALGYIGLAVGLLLAALELRTLANMRVDS